VTIVASVYLLTGLYFGLQLTDSALNLRSDTSVTTVAPVYLLTGLNAGLQLTDSALKLEEQHSSDK
jgi:LytS/YehU family sensor histidine kinase